MLRILGLSDCKCTCLLINSMNRWLQTTPASALAAGAVLTRAVLTADPCRPLPQAVAAPMVAAGVSGLLLLYGVTLITVAVGRAQLFRTVPRSIQLGDNETTGT